MSARIMQVFSQSETKIVRRDAAAHLPESLSHSKALCPTCLGIMPNALRRVAAHPVSDAFPFYSLSARMTACSGSTFICS